MTAALVALAAALTMLTIVLFLHRQDKLRTKVRARYLDSVQSLFTDVQQELSPTGFPRISGHYRGQIFDLQVVPDTLTYRKLPTLWLLASLPEPLPLLGTLDIMLRPMGSETFSHFNELPVQITPPPGFPPDCAVRCDDPQSLPSLEIVATHLASLDWDGLKEVLISPKGLRLVWLVDEADRGRYLLFRDSEMGQQPLTPARLQPILAALRSLHAALTAANS